MFKLLTGPSALSLRRTKGSTLRVPLSASGSANVDQVDVGGPDQLIIATLDSMTLLPNRASSAGSMPLNPCVSHVVQSPRYDHPTGVRLSGKNNARKKKQWVRETSSIDSMDNLVLLGMKERREAQSVTQWLAIRHDNLILWSE